MRKSWIQIGLTMIITWALMLLAYIAQMAAVMTDNPSSAGLAAWTVNIVVLIIGIVVTIMGYISSQ